MNSTINAESGMRREIDLQGTALNVVEQMKSYLNGTSVLFSTLLEEKISRKNVIRINSIAILWFFSAIFAEGNLAIALVCAIVSILILIFKK